MILQSHPWYHTSLPDGTPYYPLGGILGWHSWIIIPPAKWSLLWSDRSLLLATRDLPVDESSYGFDWNYHWGWLVDLNAACWEDILHPTHLPLIWSAYIDFLRCNALWDSSQVHPTGTQPVWSRASIV